MYYVLKLKERLITEATVLDDVPQVDQLSDFRGFIEAEGREQRNHVVGNGHGHGELEVELETDGLVAEDYLQEIADSVRDCPGAGRDRVGER